MSMRSITCDSFSPHDDTPKTTHKLIIPGTLPGLNEYTVASRTNRYAAAQMKKKIQQLIEHCIMQQLRGVRFEKPVRIAFTWCEPNRKRDKDNIAFAKKFIFDALVESGVIPNDGWKNIDSFSDSFTVDAQHPRVEVEIKEVEE